MTAQRRSVPRTDVVLSDPRLVDPINRLGRSLVKIAVVSAQSAVRSGSLAPESIVDAVLDRLPATASSLRPVINASGVLLHTNLGRAPLSDASREALVLAAGTVNIELDLESGQRAQRGAGVIQALTDAVPSAEAALVVNNGAAALLLVITALAGHREVVVSRGELVEIGDGFRLPDLLRSTGATLREVGTTNRTTVRDYEEAVTADTGLIVKIHPSNFVITGFTRSASLRELSTLQVPVVMDVGSGLLTRFPLLPDEPDVETSLAEGADIVTASADKLLGGPQAGLIFGRADLVETVRRHPLARALRVDKLTLAALEATVTGPPPPIREYLSTDVRDLANRAEAIRDTLAGPCRGVEVVSSEACVGGGGAPGVVIESVALAVPSRLAEVLRHGNPAVLARVEGGRCLLDLRSVPPELDAALGLALLDAFQSSSK